MGDLFTGANDLHEFAVGERANVPDNLNANFSAVENVVNGLGDRVDAISASTAIDQADAGLNIPNLLANGAFQSAICGGDSPGAVAPTNAADHSGVTTRMVEWCDCWYYEPTDFDDSPTGDPISSIEVTRDETTRELVIAASSEPSYTGPLTGFVFQRVDYHIDIEKVRGRSLVFAAQYTALTAEEFYLEVDDGVTQTQSDLSELTSPGTGTLQVAHVIAAGATKLTVKIVLNKDADSGVSALRIARAYARLGAGTVSFPAKVPPERIALDHAIAKHFHAFFLSTLFQQPALNDGAGKIRLVDPLHLPPILYKESADLVASYDHQPGALATDVSDPAVTVTQITTGFSTEYSDWAAVKTVEMRYSRAEPTDGSSGFSSAERRVWLNVIPAS